MRQRLAALMGALILPWGLAQTAQLPDVGPHTAIYIRAWENYAQGDYDAAGKLAEEGLRQDREAGQRQGMAEALNLLGSIDYKRGDYDTALRLYTEAEQAAQESGYSFGLARDWSSLGSTCYRTGQYGKAKEYYEKSLQLRRKLGGEEAEVARGLNDLANVYQQTGELTEALALRRQSLGSFRRAGDETGIADVLNDIGWTYDAMGREGEALAQYRQSLAVTERMNLQAGTADNLDGIGILYGKMGRFADALKSLRSSLDGYEKLHQEDEVSLVLNDTAEALLRAGRPQEAIADLERAANLEAGVGNVPVEADTFGLLMRCWRRLGQPAPAIYYGKRSVNLLQQERRGMEDYDQGLEKSFLASKTDNYRELADLLIEGGRLPEAQQILDLLKVREYREYVRGGGGEGAVTLTAAEQQAEAEYEKATAQIVAAGQRWSELRKVSARTPEEEGEYQRLSSRISQASAAMDNFFARLQGLLEDGSRSSNGITEIKGETAQLRQMLGKMPHTTALYTVVTPERTSVIVVTGTTMVARTTRIAEKDLNAKVAALQEALRNPGSDPRPQAQDLYRILVAPVQADLDEAGAQTLVWSLDGALRYIPMAALYSGQHYLLEQYNVVTITPASISHLAAKVTAEPMDVAGMGISRQYERDLPGLPAVEGELDGIVRDPHVRGAEGVLPGALLLNSEFTESGMEKILDAPHTIVHIASHFVFTPGDDNASYLLLAGKETGGSGYHLTVAEFRDNPNLSLADTQLLTLSACETGIGSVGGDGHEVDGLATTAQLKGAEAVISSLWEVDDESTGALMADFYRRWADGHPGVAKAEALRQAQLDLLRGAVHGTGERGGRGVSVSGTERRASGPWAHPYYWAPFVLMGNWQ